MNQRSETNVVPFRGTTRTFPDASRNEEIFPMHIEPLCALISAVANKLNVDDDVVEAIIKTLFNIKNVNKLAARDFKSAVKFLIDLHGNAPLDRA